MPIILITGTNDLTILSHSGKFLTGILFQTGFDAFLLDTGWSHRMLTPEKNLKINNTLYYEPKGTDY
jgi:hypothetical protein